jgi:hypothetical protein
MVRSPSSAQLFFCSLLAEEIGAVQACGATSASTRNQAGFIIKELKNCTLGPVLQVQ